MSQKQVALIILDGWGHSAETENNAVAQAKTPYFDYLINNYPHTLLEASGEFVGLPEGQVGNSEIGHTTIGAGKIIDTDLVRINKSIRTGEFQNNQVLNEAFTRAQKNASNVHVFILLSSGGVHSHQEHLFAFLDIAKKYNQTAIIHVVTDGRDTDPKSAVVSIQTLQKHIAEKGFGKIATVCGRYFAMDRDNNWNRLEKFTNVLFGKITDGSREIQETDLIKDIQEEIGRQYVLERFDEHLEPIVIENIPLAQNDSFVLLNFRSDRVRMLTSKLLEKRDEMNLFLATMTEYSKDFDVSVAFPAFSIETTLAAEVAKNGLTQAHIAETEKFPHATYFLNGGREKPHENEEHVLLESRKDVRTHNEAPEMRAEAIADEAVKRINDGVNFIFINFANPDMVGHTADVPAIISAVETVDRELKKVVESILANGGVALITADHGNAELNVDPTSGSLHTSHTLNKVPLIVVGEIKSKNGSAISLAENGSLQDLAPTTLAILDIEKPYQMTGSNLIV